MLSSQSHKSSGFNASVMPNSMHEAFISAWIDHQMADLISINQSLTRINKGRLIANIVATGQIQVLIGQAHVLIVPKSVVIVPKDVVIVPIKVIIVPISVVIVLISVVIVPISVIIVPISVVIVPISVLIGLIIMSIVAKRTRVGQTTFQKELSAIAHDSELVTKVRNKIFHGHRSDINGDVRGIKKENRLCPPINYAPRADYRHSAQGASRYYIFMGVFYGYNPVESPRISLTGIINCKIQKLCLQDEG